MSKAGIRSNRGDDFEREIALYWIINLISNNELDTVEMQTIADPKTNKVINIDDIIVRRKDGRVIYAQCKIDSTDREAWKLSDNTLKEELVKARKQLEQDNTSEVIFYSQTQLGELKRLTDASLDHSSVGELLSHAGEGNKGLHYKLKDIFERDDLTAFNLYRRIKTLTVNLEEREQDNVDKLRNILPNAPAARAVLMDAILKHSSRRNDGPISFNRERVIAVLSKNGIYLSPNYHNAQIVAHLDRLSDAAVRDAGYVGEAIVGDYSEELGLGQNLYVTRSVESKILDKLLAPIDEDPVPIMIIGEAGFGKTSMLWSFYHIVSSMDGWKPWFIKASSLLGSKRAGKDIETTRPIILFEDLEPAVKTIKNMGLRPIVLIDTVDLLLHDESDRDLLMEVLTILRYSGCKVVTTCRPQEARHLKEFEYIKFDLREYDDDEFPEAIIKHAVRLYQNKEKDVANQVDRIEKAVADGRPVREVCKNPLTLRMLFTLYAPKEVPLEINVFKLYQAYWDLRIAKDHRAGSPLSSYNTQDLSKTAGAVAISMLAEGSPDIQEKPLKRFIENLGLRLNELNGLLSRGVVHYSGMGTYRFFHQTFFEHCAAREIIGRFGEKGIILLEQRMTSRPNDLFINPVYEHALLLAETEMKPVKAEAARSLIRLASSKYHVTKSSVIYVYVHKQHVTVSESEAARKVLSDGDKAIVLYYLGIAYNYSDFRLSDLFTELDAIWERDIWQERQGLLNLLERITSRSPERIRDFLVRHDILMSAHLFPAKLATKKVLEILVPIVIKIPYWGRDVLSDLIINSSLEYYKVIQGDLIEALLKRAPELSPELLSECCALLMKRISIIDDGEAVQWLGRLIAFEWLSSARPFMERLDETSRASGTHYKVMLRAISDYLLSSDEKAAAAAWSCFESEADKEKRALWAHMVIPNVISGTGENAAFPLYATSATKYMREKVSEYLCRWSECSPELINEVEPSITEFRLLIRRAVRIASLPHNVLAGMLNSRELREADLWLNPAYFSEILVDAFKIGHVGARKAIKALLHEPRLHSTQVINSVGSRFAEIALTEPSIVEPAIAFYVKYEKETSLLRILDTESEHVRFSISKHAKELDRFYNKLVMSNSSLKRRSGLTICIHLLQARLIAPPNFYYLQKSMIKEHDIPARAHYLTLIGLSAAQGAFNFEKAAELLMPYTKSQHIHLRETAILAVLSAIVESDGDPAPYLEKLVEAALSPPTNANRLSRFGWIIERLCLDRTGTAIDLVEKIFLSEEVSSLGNQPKRTLITKLRQPFRTIVHAANYEERRRIADLVRRLDAFLGRILIDALCHEAFEEMAEELNKLLENKDVSEMIKELIRRHKYLRERTKGGEGWPEILELMR